jgi:hypothetical protein
MPPPKKETNSGDSFLKAAIRVGTAGGLYASYRKGRDLKTAKNSFIETSQAVAKPSGFANKTEYLAFLEQHKEFMQTPEGAELTKQAWLRAAENVSPSSKNLLSFTSNLQNAAGTNVYSAIEATIQRNESKYIGRTVFQFKRNFNAFRSHYSLTKTLPQFTTAPATMAGVGAGKDVAVSALPSGIQGYVSRMQQELGGLVKAKFYTRKGWKETGHGQYLLTFDTPKGKFSVNVPLQSQGTVVEGLTQSSTRIGQSTRLFDKTTKGLIGTYTAPEFMLYELEKTLIPAIQSGKYQSGYDIQKVINTIYEENIGKLEAVPNIPANLRQKGWKSYTGIKSRAVRLRLLDQANQQSIFRIPGSEERMALLRSNRDLTPFTSPGNLAEATYSTYDPRALLPTPEAIDFSRSPRQMNREWKATEYASRAIRNLGRSKFETVQWQRDMGVGSSPLLKAIYIDPERHSDLLQKFGMAEGEHLFAENPEVRRMLQSERIGFSGNLKSITPNLEKRIREGRFTPGEILGMTTEGEAYRYQKGMNLLGLQQVSTKGKGAFYQLSYKEVYDFSEAEKTFGTKGMGKFVNEFNVQKEIAPLTQNAQITQGFQTVINMDILKKDRQLHNQQMLGALHEAIVIRFNQGANLSGWEKRFYENPVGIGNMLSKQATTGNIYSHENFVANLMRLATQKLKVNPEEFGVAFGSVPYTMGLEWAQQQMESLALSQAHRMSLFSGISGGLARTVFAGPHSRNAGTLGALEPRVFEQLTAGQFGPMGDQIAEDLFNRLRVTNPEQFETFEALTKSLRSMTGVIKPGKGEEIWDLSNINKIYESQAFQEQIEKGSFWLRTGKFGIPDIYVPGVAEASRFERYKTAGGEAFRGDISSLYHDYARKAGTVYQDVGQISKEELQQSFEELISGVHKQQAPLGKGAGALFGGKVLGSRYLTAVSSIAGYTPPNLNTVGISPEYLNQMMEEMKETGLYDTETLVRNRKILERGGTIPGMIRRDPAIGSYSQQLINFQMMKNAEGPVIAVPSRLTQIAIQGEEELNPVKLGPMLGLSGDYDGDTVAAFLLNPKLNKDINQHFTSLSSNSEYQQAYIQHQIRTQLMQAKGLGVKGEVGQTILDKMIADAEKLGTTESWVPKLSNELTAMKAAVHSKLSRQTAVNARALLEFAEQVPVSGKKLPTGQVLNRTMESLFQTMHQSVQSRDPVAFTNVINRMLESSGPITKRLLTGDLNITLEDQTPITLKGMDLEDTVNQMMGAYTQAQESGEARFFNQLRGQSTMKVSTLRRYLSAGSEFLQEKTTGIGSMFKMVSATIAGANELMAVGKKILTSKKVGFGFAGAIGLAMALSSPKDSIGPAVGLNTQPNLNPNKGSSRVSPDQIAPSQPLGSPTSPDLFSSPNARIAMTPESGRISIRATSDRTVNKLMLVSNMTGSNSSINISDRSERLNKHVLINKLLG